MRIQINVPATTSNLGPGFDAVGMALQLVTSFEITTGVAQTRVDIEGYGREDLPRDERNLVLSVAKNSLERRGLTLPALHLTQHNRIPLGGGLGSSSTAIVAGLALAQVLAGEPLDRESLLRDACALEGHPDNAAPCVMGGLVTALWSDQRCQWLALPIAPALGVVTCTPALSLATKEMRAALPDEVPFGDAVHNGVHACMLIGALSTGRLDLLQTAVRDRLHERFRAAFVPGYSDVVDAAYAAGAAAVTLSGAGPTLIALTDTTVGADEAIATAMRHAFVKHGLKSKARILTPRSEGFEITVGT